MTYLKLRQKIFTIFGVHFQQKKKYITYMKKESKFLKKYLKYTECILKLRKSKETKKNLKYIFRWQLSIDIFCLNLMNIKMKQTNLQILCKQKKLFWIKEFQIKQMKKG